jgi:DNA-binding transcriptional LysR family regulator
MLWMNMDLRSLKHVVVLSRVLSYTKAAQELHLTQSALSRSIQAVERHANVKLFDRDRGGVRLTAVGRRLVTRAASLLRDADELDHMLKRSSNAEAGEVSFGIGPLAAQSLLPCVLAETLSKKPQLRTNVMVRNADALLRALLKEELEFVISAESNVTKATPLMSVYLGSFPMSLIVRADHPLFSAAARADKRDYPVLSPGHFTSDRWPRHYRRYLSGPLHVIDDYGVASRITEITDAIWLSSKFSAALEIRAGRLREIPLSKGQKELRSKMMMYSLPRRSLSPAALMLKQSFQKQIGALAT